MERPFTEKEKTVEEQVGALNEALCFGPEMFEMPPGRPAGDPGEFGTGDRDLAVTTVCNA